MGILTNLNKSLGDANESGVDPNLLNEEQAEQGSSDNLYDNGADEIEGRFQESINDNDEEQIMADRNRELGSDVDSEESRQDDLEKGTYVDAGSIDAGIAQQFDKSLARGVATVIGGLGDISQAVPGLLVGWADEKAWQENTLSEFFHGIQDSIQSDNKNYIPEEFREVSLKSLGSVDGWKYLISNQIAESIPYMAEFMLTGFGAGAITKKGASILAKSQLKRMAARSVAKGGIKQKTKDGALKYVSRQGVESNLKKGGSLIQRTSRALLTENGLTKGAGQAANMIGAGAANNQLISISQAAEAVNEARLYKDDQGNRIFNDEELAQIGRDTWQTEFAYIGLDILSWGFTFGKVTPGSLIGLGGKTGKSLTKTTGARIAKVAQKFGLEGTEETFQEVYEEWAKKSSIDKAKLKKGLITEDQYLNSDVSKGFFDYYTSKETEGLKIVAGLMGGMMAGGKASIDLMAEKSSLLNDKEELVRAKLDGNNQGDLEQAQEQARQFEIAELVQRGYHDSLDQTYKEWVKSGSATEEEYQDFVKDANEYVKIYNKSQNLNIDGAQRLYTLMAENKTNEIVFDKLEKESKQKIAEIKSLGLGKEVEQEAAKEQFEDLKKEKEKIQLAKDENNAKISNLILGKKAEAVINKETGKTAKTKKGDDAAEGLSDKDYQRYTVEGESETKNKTKLEKTENAVSKGFDYVKGLFKGKAKKETPEEVELDEEVEKKEEPKSKGPEPVDFSNEEIENEFSESLETENDKFGYIFQKGLTADPKDAQSVFRSQIEKFFGKNPQKAREFAKFYKENLDKVSSVGESQEALRGKFKPSGKPGTKVDPNNQTAAQKKSEQFKDSVLKEDNEDDVVTPIKEPKNNKSPKGNFRKDEDGKDILDENAKPKVDKKDSDKDTPEKNEDGSIKSDGRKKIEEEAKEKNVSIKTYLEEKISAVREAYKKAKNSKEVKQLITDIESIEEFQEVKKSKMFRDLVRIKKEATLKSTLLSLKESLKTLKGFVEKRSVLQQIRVIEDEMSVRAFKKNPKTITREITSEVKSRLVSIEEIHSMHGLSAEPGTNARLSIIRKNLQRSHPGINIVMVDDLLDSIGVKGVAYVLGSTIYINPNAVFQPKVIAHEFSHVYYSLTKDDESTKRLVKQLSQNLKQVDKLKAGYWDQMGYVISTNPSNPEEDKNTRVVYPANNEIPFKDKAEFIRSYEADGFSVSELPIDQQEVIQDELFAYHMEREVSKEYDEFFEKDNRRKRLSFYEKGFFKNAKSKLSLGFIKSTEKQQTLDYLKDLDIDGIPESSENLEAYIAKEFTKGFDAKKIHGKLRNKGRRRLEDGGIDYESNSLTDESMRNQSNVFNDDLTDAQLEEEYQVEMEQVLKGLFKDVSSTGYTRNQKFEDEIETNEDEGFSEEEVESGNLDDKADFLSKSITNQLNHFVEDVNEKFFRNNKTDRIINRDQISGPIRVLAAKNFYSNLDFIADMENSGSRVVQEYLEWLKTNHEKDYRAILVSTHTSYSDNLVMDGVMIDSTGNDINITSGLSRQDVNSVDLIMDDMNKSRKYRNAANQKKSKTPAQDVIGKQRNNFDKAVKILKENSFLPADKKQKMKSSDWDFIFNGLFRTLGLNPEMKEVLLDGNYVTLKAAIEQELPKATVINVNGNYKNAEVSEYKLRKLLSAIVSGNRVYSGAMIAENAEGNNVSMENKSMYFAHENKRIAMDMMNPKMTAAAFAKKYDNNPLIMAAYKAKKPFRFLQTLGSKFDKGGKIFKKNIADQLFLSDFIFFLKSNKEAYIQPMPVNGESARRYYTTVPKIKIVGLNDSGRKDLIKTIEMAADIAVKNGDDRFSAPKSSSKATRLARQGQNLQKELRLEVQRLINTFESNPELLIEIQSKTDFEILNKNGKVTPDGRSILSSYALNHTINQIYAKDLFYSGLGETEINKRGKGSGSPTTPINSSGNMRMGIINIADLEIKSEDIVGSPLFGEKVNTTDSMNFILPADTERIQAIYGGGMKVGKIQKLFSFAKERLNPKSKNKMITIKGLTFSLTDQFVKDNPGYKPLRDLLKAQRDYYIEMHNGGKELPYNLNNGEKNFLPMAVAASALKTGGITKNTISLDELSNTESALAKVNEINEFDNGNGYGFNGSEIGVQNIMDKNYKRAVMASQLKSNLFINSNQLGNLKRVEGIQSRVLSINEGNIKEQVIKYMPKDSSNITPAELKKLKKFISDSLNEDIIDPVTLNIIKEFTVSLPYVQSKISQIMKNKIVKSGLRMYTDGTVGLQMADFGMYKSEGGSKKSSTLKSYGMEDSSTVWTDSKGNKQKATTPAESTIPHNHYKNSDTRLREQYDTKTKAMGEARKIATKSSEEMGLRNDTKKDYISKHTAILFMDNNDGTYSVRGEIYLATRIPSHGLQTTVILEAKNTTGEGMGSAVIIPSDLSNIMGSDFDGDALYMNMSNNKKKSDSYLKREALKNDIIDYMTGEDLQSDLLITLNIKEIGNEVNEEVKKITGIDVGLSTYKDMNATEKAKIEKDLLMKRAYVSTPTGQKEAFKDNVETRSLVGISASLHRFVNVLAAYETKFNLKIDINGVSKTEFKDEGEGNTRSTKTALLLNVILDNANNKIAEKMGITPATSSQFILLAGMGYDIPTIATIMLSDGAKAWATASNNRNNDFVKDKGKSDVIKKALELAGLKGIKLNSITSNIDTTDLNSDSGKIEVLQLLSNLDKMQEEGFKVNGVLSNHKSMESNPYLLEKQVREYKNMINGDGIIQYDNETFNKSPFVQKYQRAAELAIEVNKKTNVVYSATGRNIMAHIEESFEKELGPRDYNLAMSKIMKAIYLDPFKSNFDFNTAEIKERLYGVNNVFDRLSKNIIETNSSGKRNLLQENLVITNQQNTKRITLNQNLINFSNKQLLKETRKQFLELPADLREDLMIYDFVTNSLQGTNSIFPIFDKTSIDILGESFNEMLSQNSRSKNMETISGQKDQVLVSLHTLAKKLPYDEATNSYPKVEENSELFNSIVGNKAFVRTIDIGKFRYVAKFNPLTDKEISEIRLRNNDIKSVDSNQQFSQATKLDMVSDIKFTRIGDPLVIKDIGTFNSPLFNDINILNAKVGKDDNKGPDPDNTIVPIQDNSKKKSSGRSRLDGAEGVTYRLSREQWNSRNDLTGSSVETNKSYQEYTNQYDAAKDFFNKYLSDGQADKMTDERLLQIEKKHEEYQPEAASLVMNAIGEEQARRESAKMTSVTGVTEGKDLSVGSKWFISSNIPSRLPAMQSLAKKVGERFKSFLRSRNESYELIKKATDDLYKSKFDNRISRINPFKNKDHYQQLYGNLVIKEQVGEGSVNNIRLKDKVEIEKLFKAGKLSKEEKAFYDVFTGITSKYKSLLDGKDDRRGYIPHTKQSVLESYSNRGMLGAFMNFQSTEDKVRDVVLKGYDPIQGGVMTQSFKKFEDSYNAVSTTNKDGNKNKFKAKDLTILKYRAQQLLKKGINEDGTEIKMSSFAIETLANQAVRNRFTNQRSNKATLYPSMDLNKAIMDYTHSSAYASEFRDMLPEVQGLISYYKNKGNVNAVKLLETYYRDKIIRGKNPTGPLGKGGDVAIKALNTFTVFKLLGFQTAFALGNIVAGKYHNIKNGNTKNWADGEKRFWGFDGSESGIKGWASNFKASMDFLRKIGFMEQNVYEDINLEKQWNPITKLETLALLPMTLSEKWIQGVQFLGMLSEEEWNDWKNNGKMISIEKQSQYEDDVKKSQGRGYNFTDQRLISLYSLGQTFMMFSKFIPTMMADRFNQEEIDAYGRKNIGSLRQFKNTATEVISGRMSYGDFKAYRGKLPDHQKIALDKAVKGMALVVLASIVGAAAGGIGDDDTKYVMDGLVMDANYSINAPKLARKLTNIPAASTLRDMLN